jgi:hypothetical protein
MGINSGGADWRGFEAGRDPMRKFLAVGIMIVSGLLVLAGYAFQDLLAPVTSMILDWGVLIFGFAMLVGIGALLRVHLMQLLRAEKSAALSAVTLIAFLFTLIVGLFLTTENKFFGDLILNIQIPVETSLLAVLAVTLFFASLRLIRTQGWTPMSTAFLVSAVIILLVESGLFTFTAGSPAGQFINFIRRLPIAGSRGILLGMALGGLLVGLRVLLAVERPYGED